MAPADHNAAVDPLDGGVAAPERLRAPIDDPADRSLLEDVEALYEDGKTYLQAELAFQKSRTAFVLDRTKGAMAFGALGAAFGFLALIGLTVGLIIALAPLLTAWGALALVVTVLLVSCVLAFRAAATRFNAAIASFDAEGRP